MHNELYVFVVAADWAIWFTRFDGTLWKPWSSLGGSFVSEPVAMALFPQIDQTGIGSGRIDVFGVHSGNHALWHNWFARGVLPGSQGWHGWHDESDGPAGTAPKARYACAPGIAVPDPALTPASAPPDHFRVVVPERDGTIHLRQFDGRAWTRWDQGPPVRLPSSYLFSLDSVDITSITSPDTDTDVAAATLGVGARAPQSSSYHVGEVGTGHHGLDNLRFGPDTVELGEPVLLSWSIVNSGSNLAASILVKATEDSVDDGLKAAMSGLVGLVAGDILGSIGGAIVSSILESVLGFAFGGCDGIVDVGSVIYPNGRTLQKAVLASPGWKLTGSTPYIGKGAPPHCTNPRYTVNWSIQLTG